MSTKTAWDHWWKATGSPHLTLLLWAVWNPIGPVPLDEYENYSPRIVSILGQAHEADAPLAERADDDDVQRERNRLRKGAVERLAEALSELRVNQMGGAPAPSDDQGAASILLDWYEWSMLELQSAA